MSLHAAIKISHGQPCMQNAKQKEESRPKIEQRPFSEFGEPTKLRKRQCDLDNELMEQAEKKKYRKPTQLVVRNN